MHAHLTQRLAHARHQERRAARTFTLTLLLGMVLALVLLVAAHPANAAGLARGPYPLLEAVAVDGDTVRGQVEPWPGMRIVASIRLLGVDTPEMTGATDCERALARAARDYTAQWLAQHAGLTVTDVKPDKYSGRYDARILAADGADLAADLLTAGHGRAYAGGTRLAWCAAPATG